MLTITGPGSIAEPCGGLVISGPGWRVEVHARVTVPGLGEAILLADGHWMTLPAWRRWMSGGRRGDPPRPVVVTDRAPPTPPPKRVEVPDLSPTGLGPPTPYDPDDDDWPEDA